MRGRHACNDERLRAFVTCNTPKIFGRDLNVPHSLHSDKASSSSKHLGLIVLINRLAFQLNFFGSDESV
jgi:hypothetical protein